MKAIPRIANPVPIVATSGLTPTPTMISALNRPTATPIARATKMTATIGAPCMSAHWTARPDSASVDMIDRSTPPETRTIVWTHATIRYTDIATAIALKLDPERKYGDFSEKNAPSATRKSNRPNVSACLSERRLVPHRDGHGAGVPLT